MNKAFRRMKLSIYVNNFALLICAALLFILLFFDTDILTTQVIQFIKNINFSELTVFSDDLIRLTVIILLCFFCYYCMYNQSVVFMNDSIRLHNEINKAKVKGFKYKILLFVPLINISLISYFKKIISEE